MKNIRNFAIVAHIDHGKSTLADRLLEKTGTIDPAKMINQILDSNPIERERGITIKLAPVRLNYNFRGQEYQLNLIDTPGHVDFSYEVSRSLSACEGIVLVVDASQGIQAQTVAHMHLIKAHNLKVIPVVNKIDLPTAKIRQVKDEIITAFGFKEEEIIEVSAKKNINIDLVIEAIILRIPPPKDNSGCPFRGLVFSSLYDQHKGVIVYIRVFDGNTDIMNFNNSSIPQKLCFYASNTSFSPVEIGFFSPVMKKSGKLNCGEVGYIATGLKDISKARVGDTITIQNKNTSSLPGYQEPKPMVFLGLFPIKNEDFNLLRESLDKLHLSDSSFNYQLRSSPALGKGFLCGFLGLLHAEIVCERLLKEFSLNILTTTPMVEYQILLLNKQKISIHSAEEFPDASQIKEIFEPFMLTTIYTPVSTIGNIMQLCMDKRGNLISMEYFGNQTKFVYLMPLSEIIINFFDKLKSISSGYASLDYEFYEYRTVDAVKLDIYINKKLVEAFSHIIVCSKVVQFASLLVTRLKNLIPRHQFQIPIQAAIGAKIIARSDIKSFRKDVTGKLYGGDRTRKDKLLDAQKKGKKRMRLFGKVSIPQDVFLKIYRD